MVSTAAKKDRAVECMLKEVLVWDAHKLEPQKDRLTKVPTHFSDFQNYVNVFEPLILEETRAQIVRSLTDTDPEAGCAPGLTRVRYLGDMGDFCVAGLSISNEEIMENFRDNDLFLLSAVHPDKLFSETELQALTEDDADAQKSPQEEDPDRQLHLMGIVEHLEPGGIRAKFFTKLNEERLQLMRDALAYDREWWIMKLCTLSTLIREFTALHMSEEFPLMNALLTGDCKQKEDKGVKMEIPPALMAEFMQSYNPSQLEALESALSGDKITLVQGPPGTGKTHVISGVLSVLLHSKEVSTLPQRPAKRFKPSPLTEDEKQACWARASPWLSGQKCVLDDFSDIDPLYEVEMDKKRRAAKLLPNIPEPLAVVNNHKRILLCAPSNGAVDELVLRIMTVGLLNEDGVRYSPTIVRVGPGAHRDVESVTLDALARAKLAAAGGGAAVPSATGFHQQLNKRIPLDPKTVRSLILNNANIVATTLSFSGSSVLDRIPYFDYVIIDEAAQAVETSTLVALKHNAKSLVLVGDPKQLPATIISTTAISYGYDQSMFERLMNSNVKLSLLKTQYRMHPLIRQFPSDHFYASQLDDAMSVASSRVQPYHSYACFGPFMFYDVRHSVEECPGASYHNEEEAKVIMGIYRQLVTAHPEITDMSTRVGVISPYKQQVHLLRGLFKEFPGVNVDTVDGYQGREKEFIIFSSVRAPKKGQKASIGFLSDVRRMNVALTRPRSTLIVVGNSRALKSNDDWRALVNHAVALRCYVRVPKKADEFFEKMIDKDAWEAHVASSLEACEKTAEKRKVEMEKKKNKKQGKKDEEGEEENSNNKKKKRKITADDEEGDGDAILRDVTNTVEDEDDDVNTTTAVHTNER